MSKIARTRRVKENNMGSIEHRTDIKQYHAALSQKFTHPQLP
jgi:hypothetical protein